VRAAFITFGCKANQYDTERIRGELTASGVEWVASPEAGADVVVVNTCVVTHEAEHEARRRIARLHRDHPDARIVVVGCATAVDPAPYQTLPGVSAALGGHDPEAIAKTVLPRRAPVQIRDLRGQGAQQPRSRAWLGIQDGCDRKCTFCATRVARGKSRSRSADDLVAEAQGLARWHPEIVLTGIHIGHYGDRDFPLSSLVGQLLGSVPEIRFRLGSIEATEVDDRLLDLLVESEGRLVPHLHLPLQSGADAVLRRMRRWHTREMYRQRVLEIAARMTRAGLVTETGQPVLGMGADIITGFPGETEADHADTVALVNELPFTYLHVFPFSPREGTLAADMARENPIPHPIAAARARELRELGQAKGEAYLAARVGSRAQVVVERPREGANVMGLTEDYLRLPVEGVPSALSPRLVSGTIEQDEGRVFVRVGSLP
jgi:threonylcarbamoyladenosine tRNA methylthiotransferase MtaB